MTSPRLQAGRLRVLLACDKLGYGDERLHGVGRLVVDWTRGLRSAGIDVTTVILRHPGPMAAKLAEESLPFVYLRRSFFDPLTILDFVRLIRSRKIQVAHFQNYGATAAGRVAARLCNVPAVVHIHGDMRTTRRAEYKWWLRGLDVLLRSSTASCIAVSDAAARSAVDLQGFPAGRVRVLRNPIDLDRFQPLDPAAHEATRRSLGILDEEPVALCVGRLFPVKGMDQLLDAWSIVQKRLPNGWLVIAGEGPERAALEAQARKLGIGPRLRMLGHRSDIENVFQASDFLVVSSRSETGPLTAVEAMATGLPVVGFRVGGVGELVGDDEQGILVEPGNIEGLAEGMVRLMSDPSLRKRLGSAALIRSKEFGMGTFIDHLIGEYRRVIGDVSQSQA